MIAHFSVTSSLPYRRLLIEEKAQRWSDFKVDMSSIYVVVVNIPGILKLFFSREQLIEVAKSLII